MGSQLKNPPSGTAGNGQRGQGRVFSPGAPLVPETPSALSRLASPQLTVDVRALMFLHLHQGEGGSDHGPLTAASPIQDFSGIAVS